MPIVSCAALALVLANPASSGSYTLTEDCPATLAGGMPAPALAVRAQFAGPLVVEAGSHRVHGLAVVNGGNLVWRGGEILSPGGVPDRNARGAPYYGVLLRRANNVTLEGVKLHSARKAVVVEESSGFTLKDSLITGVIEDGVIVANSQTIRFVGNKVADLHWIRTLCLRPGGDSEGESRRQCTADGGQWLDGFHSDVLQLRDNVVDVLASGNQIVTTGQGLTQMDAAGDRPLADVRLEDNVIASGRHGLTLTACNGCVIRGNRLTTSVPGWRSVIRPGAALACNNDVPDGGPGRDKCP